MKSEKVSVQSSCSWVKLSRRTFSEVHSWKKPFLLPCPAFILLFAGGSSPDLQAARSGARL